MTRYNLHFPKPILSKEDLYYYYAAMVGHCLAQAVCLRTIHGQNWTTYAVKYVLRRFKMFAHMSLLKNLQLVQMII